jgi:hypothetical protein
LLFFEGFLYMEGYTCCDRKFEREEIFWREKVSERERRL